MVYHQLGDELPIDINAYTFLFTPDLTQFHKILKDYPTRRVKVKGGKFILDGSIQGFTALLSKPYWVPQAMYSEDLTNYTYD
jgi:predicted amidohydrolase YtcJ